VQERFNPSQLFRPWFERERLRKERESHNQRQKRRSWKSKQPVQVKIGHGGTLDPAATGVLILGVGSGTKSLSRFLECTKSYEAVILFGAATDTYDAVGKIVARKPYDHVTKDIVEEALNKFRGSIMQRPPIYSALKVQGKPLYQYAREGKEVPVEIEERPVEVESLEMVEWMDGSTHEYHWPEDEAVDEEKEVVDKVLHLDTDVGRKRKRDKQASDKIEAENQPSAKRTKSSPAPNPKPSPVDAGTKGKRDERDANGEAKLEDQSSSKRTKLFPSPTLATEEEHGSGSMEVDGQSASRKSPCPAPACRLRMTVTSGFYVRSLAHDLGTTVNSLGLMSSLVRTRQGDFELGQNVLEYNDLAKGEDEWAPKVGNMLADWRENEGIESGPDEDLKRPVLGPKDAKPKLRAKLRAGKEKIRKKREGEQQDGESEE
jgi:tRNA pseudouridine55 synthase